MREQLAIVQNPHVNDPKQIWRIIDYREKEMEGKSYLDEEFDQVAFNAFKTTVSNHTKWIAIK